MSNRAPIAGSSNLSQPKDELAVKVDQIIQVSSLCRQLVIQAKSYNLASTSSLKLPKSLWKVDCLTSMTWFLCPGRIAQEVRLQEVDIRKGLLPLPLERLTNG